MGVFNCAEGRELTPEEEAALPPEPRGTVAERKARLRDQIEARRDQCFQQGFTVPSGPLAGKVLQTRGIEDRTNWLTSQAAYMAAISQGGGNVADASFRTADNETIVVTYSEGFAALMMMAAWGKAVMGNSWTLKDAVANASTHAALDAIDVEAGWP